MEYPQRLHHDTPGWVKEGALFHVRLRVAPDQKCALTETEMSTSLLKAAANYHAIGHWWCELFLLMPDHAHALLVFPRESGMSVVVRNWKRGAARLQSVRWQDNFFDHRIRIEAEGREKWAYIRRNPVVKGLCLKEEDCPHQWGATSPS